MASSSGTECPKDHSGSAEERCPARSEVWQMATEFELHGLRFPMGEFSDPGELKAHQRVEAIDAIASVPADLRQAIAGLSEAQIDSPYRPGGWTVRQVVHHLPDSHMNSFFRFKLGLTEDNPTIRTYHEERFADLPDAHLDVAVSLDLLEALHARWVLLLRAIDDDGWRRTIQHPDMGLMSLGSLLAFYAWHGAHHIAHITELRARRGW
jgi:uncharacterized damage-inducible protein DinB